MPSAVIVGLDSRREVEADRVRRGFADLLAALGDQLVGAAQLLAVIAEHQAALVDQAEGADIAVVARLEPARVIVLAAVDGDILDAFAERAVGEDVGRIGVGEDQRAVRGGGAKRLRRARAEDRSAAVRGRRN